MQTAPHPKSLETSGWIASVQRDKDWLYVHILSPLETYGEPPSFADEIRQVLDEHGRARIVIEMDEIECLDAHLLDELVLLHREIHAQGGAMRLSGLAQRHEKALRDALLEDRFPRYLRRDADADRGVPRHPR